MKNLLLLGVPILKHITVTKNSLQSCYSVQCKIKSCYTCSSIVTVIALEVFPSTVKILNIGTCMSEQTV